MPLKLKQKEPTFDQILSAYDDKEIQKYKFKN